MNKQPVTAILLMAAMLLAAWSGQAGQTPPADVLKAATEGLQPYVNKIPAGEKALYGFGAGDDLGAASLGTPFLVQTITPAALEKFQAGTAVAAVMSPTTMWYFPVLVAGQYRAILVVDQLDGRWQAVSLGYAGLAKELGAFVRQWPAEKGYHPVLITVFQARQHLVTVPEKDAFNLTRLSAGSTAPGPAAAAAPGGDYAKLELADDVLGALQPVVRDAVKDSK